MPVLLYKKPHQALHIVGVFAGCQRLQQGECHIKSGRRVVRGDDIVVDDDGLVRDDSDTHRCQLLLSQLVIQVVGRCVSSLQNLAFQIHV